MRTTHCLLRKKYSLLLFTFVAKYTHTTGLRKICTCTMFTQNMHMHYITQNMHMHYVQNMDSYVRGHPLRINQFLSLHFQTQILSPHSQKFEKKVQLLYPYFWCLIFYLFFNIILVCNCAIWTQSHKNRWQPAIQITQFTVSYSLVLRLFSCSSFLDSFSHCCEPQFR